MDDNYLAHYGVLGMRWGRRKSKPSKTSGVKKSSKKSLSKKSNNIKKKINEISSKVNKEKVKSVAKTTAIVAGSIAATATLGYMGGVAFREISNAVANGTPMISNRTTHQLNVELGPVTGGKEPVSRPNNVINKDVPLGNIYPDNPLAKSLDAYTKGILGASDAEWNAATRKYLLEESAKIPNRR